MGEVKWKQIFKWKKEHVTLSTKNNLVMYPSKWDFLGGAMVKKKNLLANAGDTSLVKQIPWNRKWQPAPGFLPRKFYVQRNLVGYS